MVKKDLLKMQRKSEMNISKSSLREKINEIEGTWLYVNDELIPHAPKKDVIATIDFIEGLKDQLVDMFFELTDGINRVSDAKSFKPLMPSFYEFIKKYSGWEQKYFDSIVDEMETDAEFYHYYGANQKG